MARFYTVGNAGTEDIIAKPFRTHQGPGVVKVGTVSTVDPTSMPSLLSVGLTDMDIEINPNIETSPVRSAQLFGPYHMMVTGWALQVNLSLDQMDPYQLALSLSYDVSDAVASNSSVLTLSGQTPAKYRACRVSIEGPADLGTITQASKSTLVMNFDLYKTQWVMSGGFTLSPTTKTTQPVTIHALHNSADNAGIVSTSSAITSPGASYD